MEIHSCRQTAAFCTYNPVFAPSSGENHVCTEPVAACHQCPVGELSSRIAMIRGDSAEILDTVEIEEQMAMDARGMHVVTI